MFLIYQLILSRAVAAKPIAKIMIVQNSESLMVGSLHLLSLTDSGRGEAGLLTISCEHEVFTSYIHALIYPVI